MTVDSAIARFRRRQAALFRDSANVSRPGAGGVIDPTGVYTPNPAILIYAGACLLRALAWEGTDAIIGDDLTRKRRARAKFPVDVDIQVDDVLVPTASSYDAGMVGVKFRVSDVFRDGWQITRTAIVEEVIE